VPLVGVKPLLALVNKRNGEGKWRPQWREVWLVAGELVILPHAHHIVDRGKLKDRALVQLKMKRRILGHCRDYCMTAAQLQPQERGEVKRR
jgi:hypothetical protein